MNTLSNSNTSPNRPSVYPQHSQQLPHSRFPYICISLIPSDLRTLSKTWGVYPSKANLKRNLAPFRNETTPLSTSGDHQ